jgi:ferritin-like metal-binding protein YciE
MSALKTLFLAELADRNDAEKQLLRGLPKLAKAATCKNLQKLIQSHLKETQDHVEKIETIFKSFEAKVKSRKCQATVGLLQEAEEITADFKDSTAINAAIISVAQKLEHYEIASYGCLHEWSKDLGNKQASALLKNILAEEKASNQALINLARTSSNGEALGVCKASDACCDTKTVKLPAVRRGVRPAKLGLRSSVAL